MGQIKQGDLNFAAGTRAQSIWGLTEAFVFFLEGSGSALFAVSLLEGEPRYLVPAMAVVLAAVLLLFAHLGHPMRAWRAALKVGRSWISRGTVAICFFLVLGVLYVAIGKHYGFEERGATREVMKYLLLAACLVILAYPAFTLSFSSSIPFWHNALVPLTFILGGLGTGLSWLLALQAARGFVSPYQIVATPAVLLFLAIALASYVIVAAGVASTGARESIRLLLSSNLFLIFVVLGFGAGVLVPVILCGSMLAGPVNGPLLLLLASSRGVGDVASRYALLKAGVYDAVY